jgi:hypothetical protein
MIAAEDRSEVPLAPGDAGAHAETTSSRALERPGSSIVARREWFPQAGYLGFCVLIFTLCFLVGLQFLAGLAFIAL